MFDSLVRRGVRLLIAAACVAVAPVAARQLPPPAPSEAGTWQVDAQGREYRVEPLPRSQAQKIGDDRVRTIWGVTADLAREDATHFFIKIYRVAPVAPPPPPAVDAPVATETLPPEVSRMAFEPLADGLPTGGQWREGLAVADVTGDGQPDILAAGPRKTMRPPVAYTRSGATWTRAALTFPRRPYDYGGLAFAPRTGDAPALLALGVHLRGLIALESTRPGTFEDASQGLPFVTRADESVFSSRAIALADCNGDGRLDLIALGEGPRLGIRGPGARASLGLAAFVRDGERRWTPRMLASGDPLYGAGLAMGDVDGDRQVDAAVAPALLGDTRVIVRGDGGCGWTIEHVGALRPRSFVTAVTLADLDGDGRAELVAGTTTFEGTRAWGHLDVYRRQSDGTWTRRPLARLDGRMRFDAVTTGDLDGDGRLDVAAVGPSGETFVFLADGRGHFVRERRTLPAPGQCGGSAIVAADLDADGRADLVVAHAQERTASVATCPTEGALMAWRSVVPRAESPQPVRD